VAARVLIALHATLPIFDPIILARSGIARTVSQLSHL